MLSVAASSYGTKSWKTAPIRARPLLRFAHGVITRTVASRAPVQRRLAGDFSGLAIDMPIPIRPGYRLFVYAAADKIAADRARIVALFAAVSAPAARRCDPIWWWTKKSSNTLNGMPRLLVDVAGQFAAN